MPPSELALQNCHVSESGVCKKNGQNGDETNTVCPTRRVHGGVYQSRLSPTSGCKDNDEVVHFGEIVCRIVSESRTLNSLHAPP
jgi:hypothetical protein